MTDQLHATEGAAIAAAEAGFDVLRYRTLWVCEKWSAEACAEAAAHVTRQRSRKLQPDEVGSDLLRELGIIPDLGVHERAGNLLLNEGIDRLRDLLIGAGGTAFNNANAFIGVGDTATAAAATQTELQATQNAANRFYKGMVATYPQAGTQSAIWRADFTGTEANFVWAEWTVAAGATTASGSGFLVGTTNLNRKVEALGTKAAGTWTMTATITFS